MKSEKRDGERERDKERRGKGREGLAIARERDRDRQTEKERDRQRKICKKEKQKGFKSSLLTSLFAIYKNNRNICMNMNRCVATIYTMYDMNTYSPASLVYSTRCERMLKVYSYSDTHQYLHKSNVTNRSKNS